MNTGLDAVLQTIYEETKHGSHSFVTMRSLEIELGISGYELRNIIEDLKTGCMIHEHEEGLRITPSGFIECRSRWA